MVKHKQSPFLLDLILFIISFLLFIAVACVNFFLLRLIHWISLAVFLVPPASLLCLFLWRRSHGGTMRRVARVAAYVLLALLTVGNATLMFTADGVLPSTNTHAYARIMKSYGYPGSEALAYFPASIPSDAKGVRFFQEPAWLDGPFFLLKYEAPSQKIDEATKRFAGSAKKVLDLSDASAQEELQAGLWLPSFDAAGYDELPADFQVILLDYTDAPPEESSQRYAYGVAVSRQRNVIIYFYGFCG